MAGGNVAQFLGGAGVSGHVPDSPQGAIFGAEAPEGKGLDAKGFGGAHLVQRGDGIEKPDVVLQVLLVEEAEVRIESVTIEIHVHFGIASG